MKTASATFPVRYAETDQMGVVYHANYVIWCEIGRTALINDFGFSYKEMEEAGVISPVTNINLSYKKPAKYGDDITVHSWIEAYSGARVTYGYTIENAAGDRLSEGTSEHVCCDDQSFRPIPLKKRFPAWDQAYKQHRRKK
ncbi:acyl-CoA thioesterase [Salisediminibacterium halotolerans]|uniref:acyl-CoA thioesterase n=1 Tax=Salisediminibacterium halotolerans TaxID=517425 RepID=UPI000EAD7E60|nr:thioesterase family protein [Salisediminibacterium halotolerans]RLJ74110.1 acyl-CoA thioester hydrolase [Actinophytocola xinjiangensis]RPE87796.1 acyl-CoA thioester hydrolase [Salisediminibacterium halotolerans]TWG34947.1 acyl-CoA thioester hydrolase [Salisediminibacterium halotolerans]GEL08219.1 putative acyl-CoA thioesterase YneP [Salisediminibacterium halotolerans]